MGIKLSDHINYDINNWITEEEAETLFRAAGFIELNEIKGYKSFDINTGNFHDSDPILKSEKPIQKSVRIEVKYSELKNNSKTEIILQRAIEDFSHQTDFKPLDFKGAV